MNVLRQVQCSLLSFDKPEKKKQAAKHYDDDEGKDDKKFCTKLDFFLEAVSFKNTERRDGSERERKEELRVNQLLR